MSYTNNNGIHSYVPNGYKGRMPNTTVPATVDTTPIEWVGVYKEARDLVRDLEEEFFAPTTSESRMQAIMDMLVTAESIESVSGKQVCPEGEPDGHLMGYCACYRDCHEGVCEHYPRR